MKYFKVASLTAISHLSKLLVTLFIIKQISVVHGPEGMGLLGNFMSLVSIASSLAGGGIVSGIIKYLSEFSGSLSKQQNFLGSSLLYTLIFSMLTLCFGVGFIHSVTGYVFPNQDYQRYIYFFFFAQFIVSLNNFSFGVANGLGKNTAYAGFLLGGNLIAIIVAFYCIKLYSLWGAIVAIMAPGIFPFIPAFIYALKQQFIKQLRFDTFFHDSRLLAKFSLMLFSSAVCFPIVEIIIRNQIISLLGLESAGFWQAITKLSTAYLSFYSLFLTFYLLPLISSIFDKILIIKEVNKMMYILGFSFITMMGVYYLFRDIIIRCVLSDAFLPMSDLMVLQMLGDFFRVLGWVIGCVVVAKAATKLYLLGELFQGVVFIITSHFALTSYSDLRAVILAYVVTCFCYCIFSIILFVCCYVKKNEQLVKFKSNLVESSRL